MVRAYRASMFTVQAAGTIFQNASHAYSPHGGPLFRKYGSPTSADYSQIDNFESGSYG
jgi:hypothetical protein